MTLAHVSDVHIDGTTRSIERTERVVRHISGLPGPIDTVLVPGDHDSRPQFRKVLLGAGHVHTAAATMFAGLPLYIAPGVASTVLTQQESRAEVPLDFELPPGFALHILSPDGRLTSHSRVVL